MKKSAKTVVIYLEMIIKKKGKNENGKNRNNIRCL